jgi:hypothetical protein
LTALHFHILIVKSMDLFGRPQRKGLEDTESVNTEISAEQDVENLLNLVPGTDTWFMKVAKLPLLYADFLYRRENLERESFGVMVAKCMGTDAVKQIAKGLGMKSDNLIDSYTFLDSARGERSLQIMLSAYEKILSRKTSLAKLVATGLRLTGFMSERTGVVGPLIYHIRRNARDVIMIIEFQPISIAAREIFSSDRPTDLVKDAFSRLAQKIEKDPNLKDVLWISGRSWLLGSAAEAFGFSRTGEDKYSPVADFWGQFIDRSGSLKKPEILDFFIRGQARAVVKARVSRKDFLQRYSSTKK